MSDYGFKRGVGKAVPMVINSTNAISRGRFINNIEYTKNEKAEYLAIEIIDRAGMTSRTVYFLPKKNAYIKTDEELKKEHRRFNSMMENLTKTLLGSDYETGEVSTFEEFCKKIISDVGKSYLRKELRVKLVYNTKNMVVLPKWPIAFEDPTLISDEHTKMKITQWDKVVPTEVKMDTDVKAEEKKDDLDDLPFK